mmetsp:Transcript_49387/g.160058  ORF Transcript_49387/g.160058 Transcript_49387/m.160058 type:complete len:449 (-) Transcript_49387:291-1637(-)
MDEYFYTHEPHPGPRGGGSGRAWPRPSDRGVSPGPAAVAPSDRGQVGFLNVTFVARDDPLSAARFVEGAGAADHDDEHHIFRSHVRGFDPHEARPAALQRAERDLGGWARAPPAAEVEERDDDGTQVEVWRRRGARMGGGDGGEARGRGSGEDGTGEAGEAGERCTSASCRFEWELSRDRGAAGGAGGAARAEGARGGHRGHGGHGGGHQQHHDHRRENWPRATPPEGLPYGALRGGLSGRLGQVKAAALHLSVAEALAASALLLLAALVAVCGLRVCVRRCCSGDGDRTEYREARSRSSSLSGYLSAGSGCALLQETPTGSLQVSPMPASSGHRSAREHWRSVRASRQNFSSGRYSTPGISVSAPTSPTGWSPGAGLAASLFGRMDVGALAGSERVLEQVARESNYDEDVEGGGGAFTGRRGRPNRYNLEMRPPAIARSGGWRGVPT